MRNKIGILLLIVALVVYCTWMLSFTFKSRSVQNEALSFATEKDGTINYRKKQLFEDSLWDKTIYLGNTYREVKEKELNLGLDLQGGMHVVLEVSPVEIIKAMSGNSQDPKFLEALKQAKVAQKSSQGKFIDLFYDSFKKVSPSVKLSSIFANSANKDKITYQSTDQEILKVINKEIEGAIEQSLEIVRTRIDQFGVVQPNVQRLGSTGRIQVELPGVDNPDRVRKLLSSVARLEFWEVYEPQEYFPYVEQLDKYLTEKDKLSQSALPVLAKVDSLGFGTDSTKSDTSKNELADALQGKNVKKDSATAKSDSTKKANTGITKYLTFNGRDFMSKVQDTAKVNRMLEDPNVRAIFPSSVKLLWEKVEKVKKTESKESKDQYVSLYFIKSNTEGKAPLSDDVIKDAHQDFDPLTKKAVVSMGMKPTAAREWKKITGQLAQKNTPQMKQQGLAYRIAIVLDNQVYSAPQVNEEIPSGQSQISGNFTVEEAKDLANVLKAGKVPAPMQIVEETVVGPSLGKEAISQGLITILAAFLTIIVFMIAYYNTGGLVADAAVILNLFLLIGVLASMGAILTLPGIAGIVLTVGMAVDANVLINERIKEELRAGRTTDVALKNGYSAATVTILDANITVAMAGIVLFFFGSGPVQGFATSLLLGIVTSLFTSILVTRLISEWAIERKFNFKFTTIISQNLFINFYYNFISKRKIAYIASSVFIFIGLISAFVRGFHYGVDFKGGWSYIVKFEKPVNTADVRNSLVTSLGGEPEVKSFGDDRVKITTTYLIDSDAADAGDQVKSKLQEGLDKLNVKYDIPGVSKVGPTIADDIKGKAIWSIAIALALIFAYIWMRFLRWEYAMGATIALFHDALVVVACFTLLKGLLPFELDVDQNFIAAILTIVGYSVNDTVVIFDRIRENIKKGDGTENVEVVVNKALTDTFSRSIVTAFTVFLVVVLLFVFGGQVLRGMSFALMIGVIAGSYSTLFIAVPFLVDVVKEDLLRKTTSEPPVVATVVKKGKIATSKS